MNVDSKIRVRWFLATGTLMVILCLLLSLAAVQIYRNSEVTSIGVAAPSWRGIVPGKTTPQEVLAILGKPNVSAKCPMWPDKYYLPALESLVDDIKKCLSTDWTFQFYETAPSDLPPGTLPPATHEIRFNSGRVDVIVEDTFAYADSASPSLRELVEKYGKPEKITWSRASPHLRAVLFCREGVIAHLGGGIGDQAHWIFYFVPMSLDQCTDKFASEIPAHNPFANGDVFGDENPWPWLVLTK